MKKETFRETVHLGMRMQSVSCVCLKKTSYQNDVLKSCHFRLRTGERTRHVEDKYSIELEKIVSRKVSHITECSLQISPSLHVLLFRFSHFIISIYK